MYDVITVGSSTIDVFAEVDSELIKIKTEHHEEELIAYPCGSKILIEELNFLTGGGGTNTAVSFAKLGLKVAYLGKVGSGSNGQLVLRRLKKAGVKFIGTKSRKHHTGYSIILDSIEGDRTILAYKGANNYLDYKQIRKNKIKAKWMYCSSMVDKSYETLEKLTAYANKNNIKVAFNPSNYLTEKGYDFLKTMLDHTDLLILNKEEAMQIAQKKQMKAILHKLQEYADEVVVTDGENGAYSLHKKKIVHVQPIAGKIVESTGAGDAFASTFVACKIKRKSNKEALQIALLNAESVIQNRGAKNGLLTYRTLRKRLKKTPPKVSSH